MKKLQKIMFLVFILTAIAEKGIAQIKEIPFEMKSDKCYGKQLLPIEFEIEKIALPIYIGNGKDDVDLDTISIQLSEEHAIWELMERPDSKTIVDCLVEVPAVIEEFVVVKDTSHNAFFVVEYVEIKRIVKKGGFSEWREILCRTGITSEMNGKIKDRLIQLGYCGGDPPCEFEIEFKKGLRRFQKENNLGVGQLTEETINALGFMILSTRRKMNLYGRVTLIYEIF